MKKQILFLLILFSNLAIGQYKNISLEDVQEIKRSKLIVALPDKYPSDDALKKILDKCWTFSAITEALPEKEAIKKSKADETCLLIRINNVIVSSNTHSSAGSYRKSTTAQMATNYRNLTTGTVMEICKGKSVLFHQYLPAYSEGEVPDEVMQFGVLAIQDILKTMDEKKLSNYREMHKTEYEKRGPELKNKVLLIPDGWLAEKTAEKDVKKLYKGEAKIVSYQDWTKTILERDKASAYVIIAPVPMGDGYSYIHYLVNADNGSVYGIARPKVAMGVAGINITKSNTGYINEKNIEKYAEILSGK